MNVPAALALQSIPFAGLAFLRSRNPSRFILLYAVILGLLLSAIALMGDPRIAETFEQSIEQAE
ncbi:hypothetical protein [Methylobacterium organophilum]|uniref:Uncharacterized protein n=1 Tax=Methylobacterium organophilum TaxID=410 RepID=A0ABQ4TDT8_METOR|nr:hypothetical protein [Methylobacterium organophilum]UMY15705.1 hypothetical protein MMB17_13210 [Methylobacterium organophilum]GJE28270.1 hypothetical protein LKMONMHP_3137 [Methylobacterium organophilum]